MTSTIRGPSIAALSVAQRERRWDSRHPVRRKATSVICCSKPKIQPLPSRAPMNALPNAIVTSQSAHFLLCLLRVSRIVTTEHAKASSDRDILPIARNASRTLLPQPAPPNPHCLGPHVFGCLFEPCKMQGAARSTLGNCFLDSIDAIYQLLGLAISELSC